jgi:hypothetical protein
VIARKMSHRKKMKNLRRKKDSLGERKSNRKFGGEKSPLFFYFISFPSVHF